MGRSLYLDPETVRELLATGFAWIYQAKRTWFVPFAEFTVREWFRHKDDGSGDVWYEADRENCGGLRWVAPIYMPNNACRLLVSVVEIMETQSPKTVRLRLQLLHRKDVT